MTTEAPGLFRLVVDVTNPQIQPDVNIPAVPTLFEDRSIDFITWTGMPQLPSFKSESFHRLGDDRVYSQWLGFRSDEQVSQAQQIFKTYEDAKNHIVSTNNLPYGTNCIWRQLDGTLNSTQQPDPESDPVPDEFESFEVGGLIIYDVNHSIRNSNINFKGDCYNYLVTYNLTYKVEFYEDGGNVV